MLQQIFQRLAAESPVFFIYVRYAALIAWLTCGGLLLLSNYKFIPAFAPEQSELLHLIGSNCTTIFLTSYFTKKNDK